MKIISKKQESEYEDIASKYNSLKEEVARLRERNWMLEKSNDEIVNWFATLLQNNGYQIPQVPYIVMKSSTVLGYAGEDRIKINTKEIVIPEIHLGYQCDIKEA